MMKKLIALLLAAMMVCSLAACGAKEEPAPEAEPETSTPVEEEAAPEAEAPAEDEAAPEAAFTTVEEGKLIMATNATFPPYEFIQNNEPAGIDVEIAGAIAEKLGLELEVSDMEFGAITQSVQGGKADIGLAGMTVTPERQEVIDFTTSYATGVQVVVVQEGSDLTLDDLFAEGANHQIGVQQSTTGDIYATGDIEDAGLGTMNRFLKYGDAMQALVSGKVDCVIMDNEPAKAYVEQLGGLKILDTAYAEEEYAAAMSKDNKPLYDAVNAALEELIANGTIQSIVDKYISAE